MATRTKNAQQVIPLGPWKGVWDVGDGAEQRPDFLQDCINGVFQSSESGASDVYDRLGFKQAANAFGSRQVQCVHTHVDSGGTVRNFVVANGKIYRESSAGTFATWTDVTPGGFSFITNDGYPVWAESFGDELIFNDEAQRPQRCTNLGATPVTMTSIQYVTAATDWRAMGKPTVYSGKLFLIVKEYPAATTVTNTITWSEELDSATGYAQTGYTNTWELVQTGHGKIYNILGTNSGFYYFRQNSIGVVLGEANATFTTSSTHDSVSPTVGCPYTGRVLLAGNFVYFLDEFQRIHRFAVGGRTDEASEIWRQMRFRLRLQVADANTLSSASITGRIAYHTDLKKVLFTLGNEDASDTKPGRNIYVFDALRGTYEGRWIVGTSPSATETAFAAVFVEAMGELVDANGIRRFVVGGSDGSSSTYIAGTSGGYLHVQQWHAASATPYADDAGTKQVRIVAPVHNSPQLAIQPTEIHLFCKTGTTTPAITLKYYSSRLNGSTSLSASPTARPDGTQTVDDGASIDREDFLRARAVWGVGPNATGSWLKCAFTGSSSGRNQFAFERGEVVASFAPAPSRSS